MDNGTQKVKAIYAFFLNPKGKLPCTSNLPIFRADKANYCLSAEGNDS